MHEKFKATNNSPGGAGGTQGGVGAYALEEDAVVEDAANRQSCIFKQEFRWNLVTTLSFLVAVFVFPFTTLPLQ